MESKIQKGSRVLIRAGGAGVHFGTLEEMNGLWVRLSSSRRLWSWEGALSLSEVSTKGVDLDRSIISESVEEIILPSVIEIIFLSSTCNLPK